MRWRHRRGAPPHWWPANEPWPPSGRPHRLWRGRSRFILRVAILFATLLVLSAVGVIALASMLFARFESLRLGLIVAGLVLVLVVVRVFAIAMSRIGLPLGDVVTAADRVANGDYTTRIVERGPPFIRRMAHAFNSMTARLQDQDRQRRELMADIAHELRTPLAVVQGRLEGLLDGVYSRDDGRLGELLEETRTLSRLVDDLGMLAHSERGALGLHKEPTDLSALMNDAAASLAHIADARGVRIAVDESGELPIIEIDPLRMREVLTNLLSNAIRHSAAGAQVVIGAEAAGSEIVIRVRDTGGGIPAEDLPKIFDRFHKGPQSHGSGLGLAIAKNLVEAHGGTISADSVVGSGTTMTVRMPREMS